MLSRLGHRVTLYERFETPHPIGSGLLLQPTGLAALDRLGLRGELESVGHRIERLHGVTARGTQVFDLGYRTLGPDLYALGVHRGALHNLLWDGFQQSGSAIETGCTIESVHDASGGRVVPIDATGRRYPATDLLIDASGWRSPLRAWVTTQESRPFAYGAVWATVPDIGIAPATLAQRYEAARVMLGYLPVGRLTVDGPPLAALFWSLKPGDHANWRAGFDDWKRNATRLWPELRPVVDGLAGPDDFTLASYANFTARRLSRGGVVLTGDAAHATSPQLGQGATQALIDAVVLADALAEAPDIAAALSLYAQMRRRHVRFYQYASVVMTPLFQSDSTSLAVLRDLTFDRMKRVPYLHREMVRTLAGLKTGMFRWRTANSIVNCIDGASREQPSGVVPAVLDRAEPAP
jgi:2-polyprenyl-6-methoxyphenol hydroxylase-like FAD-dependent oxidoreductase